MVPPPGQSCRVVTGEAGATSVPGVWVAGNVANPRAQVIVAAGEGSAAAAAINGDLVEEDIRDAVREFNSGASCPDEAGAHRAPVVSPAGCSG